MTQKQNRCKVYEFTPRKRPKLKTLDYISVEKKELMAERGRAKKDKKHFFIGVFVLLIIVAVMTVLSIR